jgi:2-polyprenyl-3-methyl-5-hydroxy-6-metoxy-1,4-benzoquinol methylase
LYTFASGYHKRFRDNDAACATQIAIARQQHDFVKKFKTRGRLLDIGCSAGFFLKVARDFGWETCGLEISEDTAAIATQRYGLQVIVGSLQESTFPPGYFDVVTLWDVLEHLQDPKKTLSIINQILTTDGIVVISTPNIDGLFPRLSYKVAKVINFWRHPEPPRHLFQFSKKTLGRLLERTGFAMSQVRDERIPIGYTFGSPKELIRDPKRLAYSLIFAPAALAGPLLHSGDTLIAVASKVGAKHVPPKLHS